MAAIAEKHLGAIARSQLEGSGLTRLEINLWISSERILATRTRNVFRMPGAEQTWKQALWVAVLAGPNGTVVSHLSGVSAATARSELRTSAPGAYGAEAG